MKTIDKLKQMLAEKGDSLYIGNTISVLCEIIDGLKEPEKESEKAVRLRHTQIHIIGCRRCPEGMYETDIMGLFPTGSQDDPPFFRDAESFYIYCSNCGLKTEYYVDVAEAIDTWNTMQIAITQRLRKK